MINTIKEVYQYREALKLFIINDLKIKYRRSVIGFLWSLLNPILTMIILATVFTFIFKGKTGEQPYALYIFSGLLPWNFFANSTTFGATSIIMKESFIKQIYIPKILFPLSSMSFEFVNFFLSLVALYMIGIFFGIQVTIALVMLPYAIFILALFTFGFTLMASTATVFFRDVNYLITILMQAWFYGTPIIYSLDWGIFDTAPPYVLQLIYLNPMTHILRMFQDILCEGFAPTNENLLISTSIAIISFLFGYYVFKINEKKLVFRL